MAGLSPGGAHDPSACTCDWEESLELLFHQLVDPDRGAGIFVEPVINRAKDDTSHNRLQAFRRLRDKHAVRVLFDEVGQEIGDRSGGYTRVVKLGQRAGDGAEMAVIELVDLIWAAAEMGEEQDRP